MKQNKIADLFDRRKGQKDRRKALLYTVFLGTTTIVLFAILGLTYQIPPPAERGNFVIMGPELLDEPSIDSKPVPKGEDIPENIEESQPEQTQSKEQPVDETPIETPTDPDAPAPEKTETQPETTPTETETKPEKTPEKPSQTTQEEKTKGEEKGVDESDEFQFSKTKKENDKNSGKDNEKVDGTESDGIVYTRKIGSGNQEIRVAGTRKVKVVPQIDDDSQMDEIVVIIVLVNEDGTVFSVDVDYSANSLTTTADENLIKKAKASARKATFEKAAPGSGLSRSVITYDYKVK